MCKVTGRIACVCSKYKSTRCGPLSSSLDFDSACDVLFREELKTNLDKFLSKVTGN